MTDSIRDKVRGAIRIATTIAAVSPVDRAVCQPINSTVGAAGMLMHDVVNAIVIAATEKTS